MKRKQGDLCEDCPEPHHLSWGDATFGCPGRNGKRRLQGRVKISRKFMSEYREDLARFPGDPQAYVDGPKSLQKLWDQRQREGWTEDKDLYHRALRGYEAVQDTRSSEELIHEAYKAAEATGFDPSDPDIEE